NSNATNSPKNHNPNSLANPRDNYPAARRGFRVGVPHGVLGDIWMHLELKGREIGDHWTSRAWERGSAATDPVKSLAIFIPLEAQSDLPKATHRGRSHLTPLSERPPKATPRGRSRLYGETTRSEARSDLSERPTEVAPEGRSDLSERHAEVEGLEGQEELCFINNNGSWYKKELNFQYNNYQQKSYPNNQQSGYPPRNNQQSSYQPQQNPLSGSSAPQESSTDTLLKQILESQTRSEKHVGYELKNLHSKIDGSYNELNNKFSHLASTVLECHMEFLGTFGCIWSLKDVKQVIIGRAEHGSEVPQRRHESDLPKATHRGARISHPSRSDLPKRHPEVARVSMARRQEAKPRATSQSDPLRSLPKAGATCRSDMPRSLR
ncbi:hypothetical protein IGI04_022523, partial [Brassica rapa subsp. trilocularis]